MPSLAFQKNSTAQRQVVQLNGLLLVDQRGTQHNRRTLEPSSRKSRIQTAYIAFRNSRTSRSGCQTIVITTSLCCRLLQFPNQGAVQVNSRLNRAINADTVETSMVGYARIVILDGKQAFSQVHLKHNNQLVRLLSPQK